MNNDSIKTFIAYSKDVSVLEQSSSGGAFYHISKDFIESGGVVFGATIDDKGHVYHTHISKVDDIPKLMKSKYVESDIKDSFGVVKHYLLENKKVLFSGTPCQVAGLGIFLKNIDTTNLLTVDIVCHGVPLKKYWDIYLHSIKEQEPFRCINFRDKTNGWEDFSLRINDNVEKHQDNIYMYYFLNNYILSEKCYRCSFKGENRFSDLTLGDAWNLGEIYPSIYNKTGSSLVILRNNKLGVLDSIKKMHYCEIDYSIATYYANGAYFFSPEKPEMFDEIRNDFRLALNKQINDNNRIVHVPRFHKLRHHLYTKMYEKYGINNSKKKYDVGIITNAGYFNYGNRLQNFALHYILRKNGYKTVNINHHQYDWAPLVLTYNRLINGKNKYYSIYKASRRYEGEYYILKKNNNDFKNVKTLLYGSDQIWNPFFTESTPYTLGLFVNHNHIISYGGSFGIRQLDDGFSFLYKEQLKKIKHISVREQSGYEIIKKLGFDSSVVLDPTMLLDKSEWDKAIKKYSKIKDHHGFVFEYFISDIVERPHLDVVSGKNVISGDSLVLNQFDFIKMIKDSDMVVTDSFHTTVFSLIYGKKVVIMQRKEKFGEMFSRIEMLLSFLNKKPSVDNSMLIIESDSLDLEKLEKSKKLSLNFLFNSLKHW